MSTQKKNYFRQGDMIFQLVEDRSLVSNMEAIERKTITFGLGEHSGHEHVGRNQIDGVQLLEYVTDKTKNDSDSRSEVYFEVKGGPLVITHNHNQSSNCVAEHNVLVLEEGIYVRINSREYDPFEKMIRAARD